MKKIGEAFAMKVVDNGCVYDTKNYRYYAKLAGDKLIVEALPIAWLDTTRACDQWEEVYRKQLW